MCLPNFIEFKQIEESNPLIGYRSWRVMFNHKLTLTSLFQIYDWNKIEGPHEVTESDSGIYAYNNYYCYYNNIYYYYNYYYNNYYNNNNNYNNSYNNSYNNNIYNNYKVAGIIKQWGLCAVHEEGQRSEFAEIDILFTIRESDAQGSSNFLAWIKEFNLHVKAIADRYNCKTMHWQDFLEKKS